MAAQLAALPGSVAVTFDSALTEGQYKLLEVSEAVLADIIQSEFDVATGVGKGMVEFRGSTTDEAALVTPTKTFAVRLVETSNTQLLVRATPDNIFKPVNSELLYEEDAQEGGSQPSPAKKQKLASGGAADSAADGVFVPQRMISGMVGHHYEVTEILPRLHVLRELLSRCLYVGDIEEAEAAEATRIAREEDAAAEAAEENENTEEKHTEAALTTTKRKRFIPPARYTTADLRRLVQASDVQLSAGLAALDAFEDAQGHWRLVHPELRAQILDSLLTLAEEKRWAPVASHPFPAETCAEELAELYERRVTKHVLKTFSQQHKEGEESDLFVLDGEKVSLLRAMQLFAKKEPYPHVSFLADWQALLPAGMTASPAMLRGHALCEASTALEALARSASGALTLGGKGENGADATKVWRYFPLSSLSPLVKTRFAQLFEQRARWSLADIAAYVSDLCAPGQTLEQLLLKHARPVSAMENGNKTILYTKR